MGVPIILLLFFFMFSFAIMCAAMEHEDHGVAMCIVGLMLLVLGYFIAVSSFVPRKVKSESVVVSTNVDGSEVIKYNDEYINLNKVLGLNFKDRTKVKVTEYETVYWGLDYMVVMPEYTLEKTP